MPPTNERELPDGELLMSLVIPESPATKKNSSRIIRIKGFIKIIPSERFMKYQAHCGPFLKPLREEKNLPPMDYGISVKVRVATDKWIVPDYTNVCQAVGDILQHYNVIADDKWIHWTDGIVNDHVPQEHWFIGVDKENPRLEMEIRRFRHPLEQYKEEKAEKENKRSKKNVKKDNE